MSAEQSNSSILFGGQYFLKIFRKLEEGINPDVEITRFLTERANFENVPAFAGTLEFRAGKKKTILALIQAAIANEGDAWRFTLDSVGSYFERVLSQKAGLDGGVSPALTQELIGGIYPDKARLLGQRTGELHRALASETEIRLSCRSHSMPWRSEASSNRCALRPGALWVCCGRASTICRRNSVRKPNKSLSGTADSGAGAASAGPAFSGPQDSHSRRFSSGPGPTHRARFCIFSISKANRRGL